MSEGKREANVRQGGIFFCLGHGCIFLWMWSPGGSFYIMLSCGFGLWRVSVVQLAAVVVIRSAGWVLQDVLQVVRQWVWW